MSDLKIRRRTRFPVNRVVPNAITLLALCAGLTGVRMALLGRWEIAVGAIVFAMIMDGLDGPIARKMKATSEFGAQLDSLSDVINFGVAPALVVYLWSLLDSGGVGWATPLVFTMCCALRLARFNVGLTDDNPPPWAKRFFTGVPAPAGAGIALLPMALAFVFGDSFFRLPLLNGFVLLAVAALMVSRLPSFSSKSIRVPRHHVGFVLLGVGAFAAFLVSTPWITLSVAGVVYVVSLPIAFLSYRRVLRLSRFETPPSDDGSPQP